MPDRRTQQLHVARQHQRLSGRCHVPRYDYRPWIDPLDFARRQCQLSREALEYAVTLASKAQMLGTFACRGKVSLNALEVLSKSPEHAAWTDMAASAQSHPDESDLKDAQDFAQWILTLYAQP